MFLASKYEDIYPLLMKTIHEKIAQKKFKIQDIKKLEIEILQTVGWKLNAPTVLDFLKVYLIDVLGVTIESRTLTKKKEESAYAFVQLENDENRIQPLDE